MTKRGTCGGCEWWAGYGDGERGRCTGWGPMVVAPPEDHEYFSVTAWPHTGPDDFCPKFEPRQEQDGKED